MATETGRGVSSRLADLRRDIERMVTKKNEAAGVYKESMRKLREEFGCASLDAARARLKSMDEDIAAKQRRLSDMVDALEKSVDDYERERTSTTT